MPLRTAWDLVPMRGRKSPTSWRVFDWFDQLWWQNVTAFTYILGDILDCVLLILGGLTINGHTSRRRCDMHFCPEGPRGYHKCVGRCQLGHKMSVRTLEKRHLRWDSIQIFQRSRNSFTTPLLHLHEVQRPPCQIPSVWPPLRPTTFLPFHQCLQFTQIILEAL